MSWLKSRTLDLDEIRAAIGSLPDATQRSRQRKYFPSRAGRKRGEVHVTRTARTLYVEALDVLLRGRMADIAVARDWELLREVARLAQQDAQLDLASTDPALFSSWRAAVTRYHLKGWTHMTPDRVDAVRDRVNSYKNAPRVA